MKKIILILTLILATVCCGKNSTSENKNNELKKEINTNNKVVVKEFYANNSGSSNTFVVSSPKGNVLIDAGSYSNEVKDYLKSIGGIDFILITHGHFNTILELDKIAKDYPNATIYMNELEKDFLTNANLNASDINGFSLILKTVPTFIKAGNIKIGGYDVEVIHSPGHTVGSNMYYFKDENILFSGDLIMETKVGSSKHPTGNENDRQNSIKNFKSRNFNKNMIIYPGHENTITFENVLKTNRDLR